MIKRRAIEIALKAGTGLLLAVSLILTFTVSDYYIFNRFGQFDFFFILSQWVKKAGLLLLPLAVFYGKRCCADIAKCVLPLFAVISCFMFGEFFDVTAVTADSTPAELVYAQFNEFMPKSANIALFYASNVLFLAVCALLVARDGWGVRAKSFVYLPAALVGCMPLNIFENFFEIATIPETSFLRFKNFTVWHFLMLAVLICFTVGAYYFLKRKSRKAQEEYLAAAAIVLLIQYHSKDSMLIGDGYNVYHTLFAVVPLFICNIGVYVAALSVFLKKRILYAMAFFVHAAGALSVFVYFGRDDMSNYGIFCSYSILYFCLTHCLLFALSVLPSALGHYRFKMKHCMIPLAYYFGVIVVATLASALVTSASMGFSYGGYTLTEGEYLMPNYAFTQINPFPVELPVWGVTVWRYEVNMLYIMLLYVFYVALFFLLNGAYYSFLAIRGRVLRRKASDGAGELAQEAAVAEDNRSKTDENEEK